MKKINLTMLMVFLCGMLFAQPNLFTGEVAESGSPGYGPKLIIYNTATSPIFDEKSSTLNAIYDLNSAWSFSLIKKEQDATGYHMRYQQYYRSIPIEWSQCLVHTNSSLKFESVNGEVLVSHEPGNTTPGLTSSEAITKAKDYVNADAYIWDDRDQEQWLKNHTGNSSATFYPSPTLCFIKVDGKSAGEYSYTLCYKVDIYATRPLSRADIYVDAFSGAIINANNKIHEGTAVTAYSGTQPITTTFITPNYKLKSTKTETYNMATGTNYGLATLFTDNDDTWNNVNPQKDQYATDAHWGTERTLAYYQNVHSRNSIDNAGFLIKSYVHYSTNYVNAFWDGLRMTYGDGNVNYTPLVTVDIVGHEITHGLTQNTANLAYQKESGALNEAFSDMFGTAIEFSCKPFPNWTVGEEIGAAFRDMSNPNAFNQPDTYNGLNYYGTSSCNPGGGNDYCGVHTNSGVANFWFYLLSQGGSGINDIGNTYSVTGVGITDAAKIAFRTLTVYLTSSSTFSDARVYSLKSAGDIFGNCSSQYIAVANAWHAVGVGAKYGATLAPTGLITTNINRCTATLNWNSNSSSSYEVNYRKVGTTAWTSVTTVTTSYGLVNLLSATSYQWRVRSVCGTVISPYSSISSFTTLSTTQGPSVVNSSNITTCSADISWSPNGINYILFYKLSTATNYTLVNVYSNTYTLTGLLPNTTYNYKVSTNSGCQMSNPVTVYSFTTANGTAPTGIVAKRSACRLYVYCDYTSGVGFDLEYRVQGATVWQVVSNYTTEGVRVYFATNVSASTIYEYRVNKIYSGTGCTGKIPSATSTITTPAAGACVAPTNIVVLSSPGLNTIMWDPSTSASGSYFKYRTVPGGTWSTPAYCDYKYNLGISLPSYLEVEVQSVCGCNGGGNSAWANQVFTISCNSVINSYSTLQCNYVLMAWNLCNATASYTLRYRQVGMTAWTTVTGISGFVYTKQYSGLLAGTQYEWQVQNVCSDNTVNPFCPLKYFTTPSACSPPTGISAYNLAVYSISVQWNAIPPSPIYSGINTTAYIVRYRPVGTTVWLGNFTTTNTNLTINGLSPSTNYEYQVQSICNSLCGSSSAWSATNIAPTTCVGCIRIGKDEETIPEPINSSLLFTAYPNPFNGFLTIDYSLANDEEVEIYISDLQGRMLDRVFKGNAQKGMNNLTWQNNGIYVNGTYMLVLQSQSHKSVKRIVQLK